MIIKYLEKIVKEEKSKNSNNLYIRSTIKEYFQILVLEYIYSSSKYKANLIFTGGTCLRHMYGLERLSEDLDFDFLEDFEAEDLASDIHGYFKNKMKYSDLSISIKQRGRQLLLKFPCLHQLGLASKSDSNLLYIKIDLEKSKGRSFEVEKTSKNIFGANFVAMHYDLPSLFAGKIAAILKRNLLVGRENLETIKGRDFYDLLWFLKKSTEVNLQFLQEKISDKMSIEELREELEEKVLLATTKFKNDFKNDLLPFISNQEFIKDYVENYKEEFERYKLVEKRYSKAQQ